MRYLLLLLVVAGGVVGCSGEASEPEGPLRVATSLPPHGWLIERVAGEGVEVVVTLPGGSSPATYQPTDRQVSALMRCGLYFRAGVPFERGGWFQAIQMGSGLDVVDLRDGIVLRAMGDHGHHDHEGHEGHDHGADDPHTWLSPANLIVQAERIRDELAGMDPAGAEGYRQRCSVLTAELRALDSELAAMLEPVRGRSFFVFHPSWGYFADRYGLEQVAIEIGGKDPTDRELTELQQLARSKGIGVVYVQPQISGRSAEAVASAIGGEVAVLDPLVPEVVANLRSVATALTEGLKNE
ncbi:metal ABC transporter solute-binding protein, Zn/Mn family [Mucisphaera calidilacus]|uniref:High-affinity zinc uptake system binding-protein ZnuA n=1 Tax=Mucisphaera calidilacus TaxID=2527982 RepID=A0A518BZP4_9BACT|nr:zinc ABC transporter substrate-binding protein [Mucisphaera calidilacus]QDU72440.1 High-affinity zinc uptake system binding-protein ZnuA precursor [Mucisphaera calidilacus]